MAYGNGTGASFGIATETTYGTYVAPDHFTEFNTESLKFRPVRAQGMGLRAGGVFPRKQRRVTPLSDAGGDVTFDLTDKSAGLILAHMWGSFPTKVGGAFTFTPGTVDGHYFTSQVGVPLLSGTVDPKTLTGCKITDWELSVGQGAIVVGKITIDAQAFSRSTGLATPSYVSTLVPFHFAQAVLKLGGSTVANVTDWTLSGSNTLKVDRNNIGSAGLKAEPVHNGHKTITGSMNAEFTNTTAYAAFLADSDVSMQITLTSGAQVIDITIPCVRYDDGTPEVGGPEVVMQSLPFTVLDDGTNPVFSAVYTTAETSL